MEKSAQKPRLGKREASLLRMKARKKARNPRFKRQELWAQKTLKKKWRRPRGKQSKMRKQERGRGRIPKPGYGSPASVRGLSRQGFREVRIFNPEGLESLDKEREAALVASTVGRKKRLEILKRAEELGVSVANA